MAISLDRMSSSVRNAPAVLEEIKSYNETLRAKARSVRAEAGEGSWRCCHAERHS